jgi:hypothetical protein
MIRLHEDFRRESGKEKHSTERGLGIVFAVVCGVIGLVGLLAGGHFVGWLIAAAVFGGLGMWFPALLRPLNVLWYRFGLLLYRITNPLIMGIIFYGAVLPTGLLMRLFGKDVLRLKKDPQSSSYWVVRSPPGPAGETMKYPF